MFKYVYARSNSSHKTKCATLEEAIGCACRDLEFGCVLPVKIEKDGEVLLSYETLLRIIEDVSEAEQIVAKRKRYRNGS